MLKHDTKVVVYTSIYKSEHLVDKLHTPIFIDKNFDYLCFTPHDDIRADGWETIITPWQEGISPRMQAKYYKIFPHKYFNEYAYSIWIDGSYIIKGALRKLLLATIQEYDYSPFIFFRDYGCDCTYIQAERCCKNKVGNAEKIREQIKAYERDGFPKMCCFWDIPKLPMCGMMFREHRNSTVMEIMERWWVEIIKYSERDQLSLPYILWKMRDRAKFTMIENPKKRLWNSMFKSCSRKPRNNV